MTPQRIIVTGGAGFIGSALARHLLLERGCSVLVVDATAATQRRRVIERSGWAPEAVDAVIAQQATRAMRRSAADAVVFNDGLTLEALGHQIEVLWRRWVPGYDGPRN